MATIKDIHTSITDMTPSDLLTFIVDMRNRRRFVPVKTKSVEALSRGQKKHQPKQLDVFAQTANMTSQMKTELLKQLMKITDED
jgi:hypothetical protein